MSESIPDPAAPGKGQFLVYEAEDGRIKIDVRLDEETLWLPQAQLAELFQTSQQNISLHIQHIYAEGELPPEATHKKYLLVRTEGGREVKRLVDHYNLDMIISVGYQVKSHVATRFRIWATQRLKEYIVKGFTLDDERLKNPQQPFDYFEELTRRIQDIRTSERRFYQKITDIYATSIEYDPTLEISLTFFKTVQNKMHWAITGQTAAEIVHARKAQGTADHALLRQIDRRNLVHQFGQSRLFRSQVSCCASADALPLSYLGFDFPPPGNQVPPGLALRLLGWVVLVVPLLRRVFPLLRR